MELESKIIEQDGLTFVVRLVLDEYADLSDLGEYTEQGGPFRVDRRKGVLLGGYAELEHTCDEDCTCEGSETKPDCPYCNCQACNVGEEYGGCEVLAEGLGENRGWREYPFFVPANLNAEPTADDVKHAVQDYERAEAYNRGDWHMCGVTVALVVDGHEEESASLWGIESDSDEDYFAEVEAELIAELKSGIPGVIAELKERVAKLEAAAA